MSPLICRVWCIRRLKAYANQVGASDEAFEKLLEPWCQQQRDLLEQARRNSDGAGRPQLRPSVVKAQWARIDEIIKQGASRNALFNVSDGLCVDNASRCTQLTRQPAARRYAWSETLRSDMLRVRLHVSACRLCQQRTYPCSGRPRTRTR